MNPIITAHTPTENVVIECLLRDGYWDRTEIIRLADGSRRVRKQGKGNDSAGPWGTDNLRQEALYLLNLETDVANLFPLLQSYWDNNHGVGYEMSFLEQRIDVAQLARQGVFDQDQADTFQKYLGTRVFSQLQCPTSIQTPLSHNITDTLRSACQWMTEHPDFVGLVKSPELVINNQSVAGLDYNLSRLCKSEVLQALDQQPQVRLHGDLHLENMLLPAKGCNPEWPTQVTLIDPVSVAGVQAGHPLFDLGKYESYAIGELPAMRQRKVSLMGFDPSSESGCYGFELHWQDPELAPFRRINWHSTMRTCYEAQYGSVDQAVYELLQAYYAAAMVLCTKGVERQARALKLVLSLHLSI
ncbi:MAG: hypothetical protein QGF64_06935 [Candidatus Poseidoniia archaeon]|nr:hypothetical protein [Candidatus Poseidoniia archaeon]